MPAVSVICNTFRPGGIDILLAGMRDQSFKDFELILVDRRYELRHHRVMKMAWEYGVQMIHVPEHRRNGKWISFCSGWNTGLALARGDVVILTQDWSYSPPGYVEAHANAVDGKRRYVMSPYVYTEVPDLLVSSTFDFAGQMERGSHCLELDRVAAGGVLDEVACFRQGLFNRTWLRDLKALPRPDQDPRFHARGVLYAKNWVHVKNESMLRSLAWELNGLDERLERGKGPMDTDWSNRLELMDVELWWEPSGVAYSPNPRFVCRTMPWGDMEARLEGRWSYKDGEAYCERRVAEIQAGGSSAAKNPYTMEELSERLAKWREGILEPLPRDCNDLDYWNRDLWPDTE